MPIVSSKKTAETGMQSCLRLRVVTGTCEGPGMAINSMVIIRENIKTEM